MRRILLILIVLMPVCFLYGQAYWKEITSMPHPVSGGQIVFNNSKLEPKFYILGGYSDELQKSIDWIQEYDLKNDQWKIVGYMDTARMYFVSNLWDSTLVYCGGAEQNSMFKNKISLWNVYTQNEPAVYDSNLNFNRSFASGHIYNNSFFLIGGSSFTSQDSISYIVEYSLSNQDVIYQSEFDTSVLPHDQMTFIFDNKIYILGGVHNGIQKGIKKFDISKKQLENMSETLLGSRAGGASIYNSKLRKALVVGGYNEKDNNAPLSSVEEIRINSDGSLQIFPTASLHYARRNPMIVNYKNTVYVFGGKNADGKMVAPVEQYTDPSVPYVNSPPYFKTTSFPNEKLKPNVEFAFQFSASDFDGDILVFTLVEGPPGSTITKSGLFKWTPTIDQAEQTFHLTVKVSDEELSANYSTDILTDSIVTSVKNGDESLPVITKLYQNYPNPFNPATSISYSLSNSSNVVLTVYNVLGQEIQKLVDSYQTAGNHTVTFNAENMHSGVYFYKIATDNFVDVKRMLLLK